MENCKYNGQITDEVGDLPESFVLSDPANGIKGTKCHDKNSVHSENSEWYGE